MPATQLSPYAFGGNYPSQGIELTMAAGDNTNGNAFHMSGNDFLVITGVGTATLVSESNSRNRTKDLSVTLAAGEVAMFHANTLQGWNGADGLLINSSANTLKYAVVRGR